MYTHKITVELTRDQVIYLNIVLMQSFLQPQDLPTEMVKKGEGMCGKFFHAISGIMTHEEKAEALAILIRDRLKDEYKNDKETVMKAMKDLKFT